MWEKGWRQSVWKELDKNWDVIVIGGGITGAGVFRRAVAEGYKTLLIEAADFAFGTSSRSSKLVHGGFRYLRNKQFDVTRESVREREWMLKEAKHLVTPLGFVMPCPDDPKISAQFALGVAIYDLLAPKWQHSFFSKRKVLRICPQIEKPGLKGAFLYYDAEMDDARLVNHIIREGVAEGGIAINYCKVEKLLRSQSGSVCGVQVKDQGASDLGELEIKSAVVINATGPWSDEVRAQVNAPARLRRLRGSHLIFPREKLPLPYAVTLMHPRDGRAMFGIPWEGTTMIGTTDLDHSAALSKGEPFTTQPEIDYILEAGNATFPSASLSRQDILSSFSGLRPVINTGAADPSKESRAHVVWEEDGLITVTGGKLTTFRIMAEEALLKASSKLPHPIDLSVRKRYFNPLPDMLAQGRVLSSEFTYLLGRYGSETDDLLNSAKEGENQPIGNLPNLWSEIRWAARTGGVEHLDDLLLRRVRLGMLLPDGASAEMERVRAIAQSELGWDDAKWQREEKRYREIYTQSYSPSPKGFTE
jgi:glycerol-3-phosphate dehydrogenase